MAATALKDADVAKWLGDEITQKLVTSMERWYGPPIAIAHCGRTGVAKGGHFVGRLPRGRFSNLVDYTIERAAFAVRRAVRKSRGKLYAGFSSLSDLIAEATTGGKAQMLSFNKAGVAGVVGGTNSLWNVGNTPPAGAAGGTTGSGAARTRTTQGAMLQANAASGDQLHVTTIPMYQASVAGQVLLMYDRLWDMTHTMTVDPRSCDAANPPTRYQTAALSPGNFFTGEVTTVLPAATPTITLDYVDQDGNNVTGPAFSTIRSSAAVQTVPFTVPTWFYPLDPADVGLRSLQNSANAINLSAAMASGVVTWIIGHALTFMPVAAANTPLILDGINSAFNLARVYDDACLAFLEIAKGATTATNWWGAVQLVSG